MLPTMIIVTVHHLVVVILLYGTYMVLIIAINLLTKNRLEILNTDEYEVFNSFAAKAFLLFEKYIGNFCLFITK
jgi:hypothetical protein